MTHPPGLFWRAVGAFLALPLVVGFVVPWLLRPTPTVFHASGAPLIALGTALLLWCVRDFYVSGKGTLAPWSPPEHLVVAGPYRYSRNPMYVGVLLILCGWAVGFRSPTHWIYAVGIAVAFHLRVLRHEEPFLAQTHGEAWQSYRARVPRWLGRAR